MKRYLVWLLCCAPAMAAVSGTVVNRSTDQPAAGVTVGFYKLDAGGPELVEETKTDAQGAFKLNQTPAGPALVQANVDGVTYSRLVEAGAPATGLSLDVYSASKQAGAARVSKHMIMLAPSGGKLGIQETYLVQNNGKMTWSDPANGTVRFYLPAAAKGEAEINAVAPKGLPIGAGMVKSSAADVFGVDFPIKPGETRIDISYSVPYTEGAPFAGKIVSDDENTYLIAPNGVSLTGANLNDLGQEPQSQAHIYGLTAKAYAVSLTGAPAAAAAAADAGAEGSDGAPQIEVVNPRVFSQSTLILALALSILAVGFAILYRAPGQDDAASSGRRGQGAE